MFLTKHEYIDNNGRIRIDNIEYLYTRAKVTRNVEGLRIKLGVKKRIRWIELEAYCGGGTRYLELIYDLNDQRPVDPNDRVSRGISFFDDRPGRRKKLDLNFGFKVSYVFRYFET